MTVQRKSSRLLDTAVTVNDKVMTEPDSALTVEGNNRTVIGKVIPALHKTVTVLDAGCVYYMLTYSLVTM